MKKTLARGVGVLVGAVTAMATFGAGTASAVDEYKGLTYEQMQQYTGGASIIVATRVGDYLPTAQCIVSGNRRSSSLDSSGNSRGGAILVDLNCTDTKTAGHPGYSVMTPQGKEAKALRDYANSINKNYEEATAAGQPSWCEENGDKCASACEQSGACSSEVEEFLGM